MKYISEEQLIERLQGGMMTKVEFILAYSPEWEEEYKQYCRQRGLGMDEFSAQNFLDYKDDVLEYGITVDNA
ncbi:MAG: hypothetical protein LIO91_06105 [Bacteroidales bacterium]|nr:hypothetical protein [Bacteroidales bacterium]